VVINACITVEAAFTSRYPTRFTDWGSLVTKVLGFTKVEIKEGRKFQDVYVTVYPCAVWFT